MWRHVAQVDIEAMFPEELAGVGIEAHHAFLQCFAFAGCVLQVDVISTTIGGPSAVRAFQARFSPAGDHFVGRFFPRSRYERVHAIRPNRPR